MMIVILPEYAAIPGHVATASNCQAWRGRRAPPMATATAHAQ